MARSCPRGELGVGGGLDTCAELPSPLERSPDDLRCGFLADDLAVALSRARPSEARLTRHALRLPAGASGSTLPLTFEEAPDRLPVLEAAKVDASGCGNVSSGAHGSGARGSGASGSDGPGADSGWSGEVSGEGSGDEAEAALLDAAGCACVGLVEAGSSDEGCSGNSSEPAGDECGGDSSAPASEDCSGGPSDTYEEGCSSGSGSDGCSGDGSDDCALARTSSSSARPARRRGPRLSAWVLALLALAVPLRRRLRPASAPERGASGAHREA